MTFNLVEHLPSRAAAQISPMYNNGKSRYARNPDSRTPGVAALEYDRYPSTPDLTLREHKDNSSDFGNILFLNEPVIFSFSNELHNNNTYSIGDQQ